MMTVEEIRTIPFDELLSRGDFSCSCGSVHPKGVRKVVIGEGAVQQLAEVIREMGCKKPFLLSGRDTFAAAGDRVCEVLDKAGMPYAKHVFPVSPVKPEEKSVGSAVMHFDYSCDCIVSIGSGVINDIGKVLARATDRNCIIVGTAPSMDGFVSATSSMDRDGLKISLPSRAPWAVIGDLDILSQAPMHMLAAGVGDVLAKIISLREWQMSGIINGDEYCPVVAALVDRAVRSVTENADALLKRDKNAVRAVMEGLVLSGIAMNYVGNSKPASGTEHYFSHIWDMRALAFPEAACDLHGIQTGTATLYATLLYEEMLRNHRSFDRSKAESYAKSFCTEEWYGKLCSFIGEGAETMVELDRKEKKYDLGKHAVRLDRIEEHWEEILGIIESLPKSGELRKLMEKVGIPTDAGFIGYDSEKMRSVFMMSKDIRDKYVGTKLFWDLGILEELADSVFH